MLFCPLLCLTNVHWYYLVSRNPNSGAYLLKVHTIFMKFFLWELEIIKSITELCLWGGGSTGPQRILALIPREVLKALLSYLL